jgi:hypothetical protein
LGGLISPSWRRSRVSRDSFHQDGIVQREIGNQLFQPGVFSFEVLEPVDLRCSHPTVFFSPPVTGLITSAQGFAGLTHGLALTE